MDEKAERSRALRVAARTSLVMPGTGGDGSSYANSATPDAPAPRTRCSSCGMYCSETKPLVFFFSRTKCNW